MAQKDNKLLQSLREQLPDAHVLSRPADRVRYASDASFYRLIPKVILQPETESEIQHIFSVAHATRTPVVFRAAGTSLSGQSITDGILVDVSRHWRKINAQEDARFVQLQPGVIGEQANRFLKHYHRKIGPDPASLSACMIGGIIANNASGMCCGVQNNSYHTLQDIRFILPNGHLYDSADPDASHQFKRDEKPLVDTIISLRETINKDQGLYEKIRSKYQRKNTTGYSLNAFVDYSDPFEIFSHLLVGSEGTLAYISRVTLRTLPDLPQKGTALLVFSSLKETVAAVWPLQQMGAEAIELMDRVSLRSVENQTGIPPEVKNVSSNAAALLVEFQEETEQELLEKVREAESWLKGAQIEYATEFSRDGTFQAKLWKIRKGLYPSVGAVRKSGTSVIIEDIAFPLEHLAEATRNVRWLLDAHGYEDGIIFGHARDGNLHFVISQEFDEVGTARYRQLIQEIVALVVEKYDGSIKAEHGTGRNMAPFVEAEWGHALYNVMQQLKAAADPPGFLNPGVILNDDKDIFIKNIKPVPPVEPEIDMCMECGFCEPVCPSRDLTTSPRQRIILWREIRRLESGNREERNLARQLSSAYQYDAVDTCAADGLCSVACPVDIDTGVMMKYLRSMDKNRVQLWLADRTVEKFSLVSRGLRRGLNLAEKTRKIIGEAGWDTIFSIMNRATNGRLPAWNRYFPGPNYTRIPSQSTDEIPDVFFFPSCLNRTMGHLPGENSLLTASEAFVTILGRAGFTYMLPPEVENLCCGTPWSSKGYTDAYRKMATRMTRTLFSATEQGTVPVVIDTSPCSYIMLHYDEILTGEDLEQWHQLQLFDVVEYLHKSILPKLDVKLQPGTVVCHPTCSTEKLSQLDLFREIAEMCAEHAVIPDHHGCCGFAGDRGLLHPELTASATKREAHSIKNIDNVTGCYSSSRTCEVGMSSATGYSFQSVVHLVEKASRPPE